MPSDAPLDCIVIGSNQMVFADYVGRVRSMGEASGAGRDLRLSYVVEDGAVRSCRDVVNERHFAGAELSYDDMLSLTVAHLCTFLSRHGLSFDYINTFQEGKDRLRSLLSGRRVMAVAVTTTYYVAPFPLTEVVDFVRSIDPDVKVIVGGPFIHNQARVLDEARFDYLLRQIGADCYVVSDQGEAALVRTLDALKDGAGLHGIDNLIYADGDAFVHSGAAPERNDLAEGFVDWRLFYGGTAAPRRRMVMVRTARSCPFSCSFCSFPTNAGPYTYAAPAEIWKTLDAIGHLGCVNSVTFIDDTFNVPPRRFETLLRGMIERGYTFRWNCNFRCQYSTRETVSLMKAAGCEGVFLGLESGSDAILANMTKQATVDVYRRGLAHLKDAGIMTYASFIVGFPGETESTVQETLRLIDETGPDFFRAQLWFYDPTTPIHHAAGRYGLKGSHFEWSHDTMDSQHAAGWVDHLHRTVRGSTWLPQNDFDFPSLFCLTSRGWGVGQIKDVVGEFNARVAREVGGQVVPIDLTLAAAARLDFDAPVDAEKVVEA